MGKIYYCKYRHQDVQQWQHIDGDGAQKRVYINERTPRRTIFISKAKWSGGRQYL